MPTTASPSSAPIQSSSSTDSDPGYRRLQAPVGVLSSAGWFGLFDLAALGVVGGGCGPPVGLGLFDLAALGVVGGVVVRRLVLAGAGAGLGGDSEGFGDLAGDVGGVGRAGEEAEVRVANLVARWHVADDAEVGTEEGAVRAEQVVGDPVVGVDSALVGDPDLDGVRVRFSAQEAHNLAR